MAPQDDLTAERAAIIGKHYECEDPWYSCPMSDEGCVNPGEGEECTCGVDTRRILLDKLLKTARQEALREGKDLKCRLRELVDACNDEMESGRGHTVSLNVRIKVGNAQRLLDRLASEGG